MNQLFLITGGNIGDRKKNLQTAATLIGDRIGTIKKSSKIYETEAWGLRDQPAFYNRVHLVETNLSARKVLGSILKIEEEMGRRRTTKNAARVIDIDILFFNDQIVNEQNLVIPHPRIADRRFVLLPMNEISPQKIHPVFQKTMSELLTLTTDELKVTALD